MDWLLPNTAGDGRIPFRYNKQKTTFELRRLFQSDAPEEAVFTSMLPLRPLWRHRCLSRYFKRELSLAYSLHEPRKPEIGHAPLVILHGLFGSKQNNRSISKYDFSHPAFQFRDSIETGYSHETSKRQCMHLSVLDQPPKATYLTDHALGFEKSW